MKKEGFCITAEHMNQYLVHLVKKGKTSLTIEKYNRDITTFNTYLNGKPVTKKSIEAWKSKLLETYLVRSVNSMVAAVNSFTEYYGLDMKVALMKDPPSKNLFMPDAKELTKEEYQKLMAAADEAGDERLKLILVTICTTGMQISEISEVTVKAAEKGEIEARLNRDRRRTVKLPDRLRNALLSYAERENITGGSIFITKNGNPCHRSNIWKSMKQLCEAAGVEASKVYPQNLRYLYVRTFYDTDKDAMLFNVGDK